jgi:hypothetical protein
VIIHQAVAVHSEQVLGKEIMKANSTRGVARRKQGHMSDEAFVDLIEAL